MIPVSRHPPVSNMKPATCSVIHHKSGQMSFIFRNINDETLNYTVSKHGSALERKYGVRFSARDSDLNVCVPHTDYILVRPLSANGKTSSSVRFLNAAQSLAVKSAVKEFIAVYNSENNEKTVISKPACPLPAFTIAQENALRWVKESFNLKPVHENQIRELLNGWDLKQKFEDGVYYVHASGKYRYLGVKQPDGEVKLLNLTKGGTYSTLNSNPHNVLTAGIVKKEVPF